jgi:predicted double-glycine peptidase
MPWLLLAYLVTANLWTLREPECYRESLGLWNHGVCIQSTDFTCGAASIATVSSRLGAPLLEHEAARLSRTEPFRGVTDLGCAMALRQHFPGRRVSLRRAEVSDLAKLPLPCLAPLTYSFWFDHMVSILEADERTVLVGDPLRGAVRMPASALAERWKGRVITIEPKKD